MSTQFKIGQLVQSTYRATWFGRIEKIEEPIKVPEGYLKKPWSVTVRPIFKADFKKYPRKQKITVFDPAWIKPIEDDVIQILEIRNPNEAPIKEYE